MWKWKLTKNKLYSLFFLIIGAIATWLDHDASFLVVALIFGIPLFFAKENLIL